VIAPHRRRSSPSLAVSTALALTALGEIEVELDAAPADGQALAPHVGIHSVRRK
jgi:hypothetical protein